MVFGLYKESSLKPFCSSSSGLVSCSTYEVSQYLNGVVERLAANPTRLRNTKVLF
ncbi:hypothetical protein BT63DRAFT_426492 [Microthyrium microscopicum]|uniref:Uncharacterized protein n=1 Tax=Microthyrium microscopicum TaxID=703497 RepID=A0A6A6U5T7_9PEZI|nr:hypothetical protein BT63DRAFT_426492 [Microthyrium microscopicum]